MEQIQTVTNPKIKDLFHQKKYMTIFIGNLISRFGDSIDSIAYAWMVYTLTGSKVLMGTLLAVNAIPNIIFTPLLGPIIDKSSKKKIVVLSFIARGLIVVLTATMFLTNTLKPYHLFIFTFLTSTMESFSSPASTALFPLVLPQELFLVANSFSSSARSFVELIGLACAGIIIANFGISGAIFLDGATFFIAGFLISIVKINGDIIDKEKINVKNYISDLKEGFKFIKSKTLILTTIFLLAIINFCLSPINVLLPAYIKEVLNVGPEGMSLIQLSVTVGMIVGGLLVAQFGERFKISTLIISSFSFMGINYALLYLPGNINLFNIKPLYISMFLFAMIGLSVPTAMGPLTTYILKNTPKQILGRVSSVMNMVLCCALPIGSASSGILCEYISIPLLFCIMGIIILSSSFTLILNKKFREV